MKRLILAGWVLIFLLAGVQLQAQSNRTQRSQRDQLVKELGLTTTQINQLKQINRKYSQARQAARRQHYQKSAALDTQLAQLETDRLAEIKPLLSPKQYTAFVKAEADQKTEQAAKRKHRDLQPN